MTLFQETEANKPQSKISKDFENELNNLYSERKKEYDKNLSEQSDYFTNLFASEEEIEQIQSKGKMDLLETASKHSIDDLLPYWGSGKAGFQSVGIYKNLQKLKNGEILSEKEKIATKKYLRNMAECQLRGRTIGGHVAEGLYGTIPFLFEAGSQINSHLQLIKGNYRW